MVVPLPRRIPLSYSGLFGAVLAALLFAEGNALPDCLVILATVLVATVGFNWVDGFATPAGSYIFFTVLFTGLLGTVVKAITDEPLVNNVPNAGQTLLIYMVGTCAISAAAAAARRFAPRKPFLAGRLTQERTTEGVIGCLLVGIGLPYILIYVSPSLGSIARRLDLTLSLAVLIGVYQRTRLTGGASSFSWPVFIAWSYGTWAGLINYSKEGIFTPSLCWIIAAVSARLRVSFLQLLVLIPTGLLALVVLVPYSTYGRNLREQTAANPQVAYDLLRHPFELRAKVNAALEATEDFYHWFDKPRGILDRLTLVPIDSALIRRTDQTGAIGIENTGNYLINIIPHFILPNKPDVHSGNDYGHEVGVLAPDDHTTGISFSPFADAYHQAGWAGVLLIMPAILFFMFFMLNLVVGGIDDTPWSLFFIMGFAHLAAEGLLNVPVAIASTGVEAVTATAFLMIYGAPLLGFLVPRSSRSSGFVPLTPRVATPATAQAAGTGLHA